MMNGVLVGLLMVIAVVTLKWTWRHRLKAELKWSETHKGRLVVLGIVLLFFALACDSAIKNALALPRDSTWRATIDFACTSLLPLLTIFGLRSTGLATRFLRKDLQTRRSDSRVNG